MAGRKIAIVGGGIAGLVAAVDIARSGGRAVIFEAAGEVGGRARTRNLNGFCFNRGPHALYREGALYAALREYGIPVRGGAPDVAAGWGLWGKAAHPLPLRLAGGPVAPLDAESTAALRHFFARAAEDCAPLRGVSLRAVTAGLPAPARDVAEAFARLTSYICAPEEVDAGAALEQLRLSFGGALYVDGGWARIAADLLAAAVAGGVEVWAGQRVAAVEADGNGCSLRLVGESSRRFGAAILAVRPVDAATLVPQSAQIAAAAAGACPVRVTCLDLGLSSLPRPETAFVLGMDAPTYMSVHSAVSNLAPSGAALVHFVRYLGPNERPAAHHFEELESLADRLQPGWRDRLVHRQRLAGMTVANDFPRWRHAGRRARGRVEDAPGVFLAGDWVGDRGMIADASAASARQVAKDALRFLDG